MGSFYGIDGRKLGRSYKETLSGFKQWEHREDASDGLVFEDNLGPYLSIDETSLSMGELYTVVTNKEAEGRKGSLVAIIKGTKSDVIASKINQMCERKRMKVKEITLDLAGSMAQTARRCFPNAVQVTDRFHVQQLASEALQEIRIQHRWEAIDNDNVEMDNAKKENRVYEAPILENGDTVKQLLVRSRYLLYKNENQWSVEQKQRADILFAKYPDIRQAYELTQKLRWIYNNTTDKIYAFTRLAKWHEKVAQSGFKAFNTISKTIEVNHISILNYFNNRNTNASAESFNAKIKAFRSQYRGVSDINFFLFRLARIYA